MSIKAIHQENGLIALEAKDTDAHVILDVNAGSRPPSTPPPAPLVRKKDPGITEIHLGPIPTPPLPLGVVIVTRDVGGQQRSGKPAPPLHLDAAFEKGRLSDLVTDLIRRSAKGLPTDAPVEMEAYLPPKHAIDVTLLSQHLSELAGSVGHPISMRVGTKIVKD